MGPASSNLASIKSALDVANEALAAWQDAVETRPGASPARSTAKIEQLVNLLITTFPGDITLGEAQKEFKKGVTDGADDSDDKSS